MRAPLAASFSFVLLLACGGDSADPATGGATAGAAGASAGSAGSTTAGAAGAKTGTGGASAGTGGATAGTGGSATGAAGAKAAPACSCDRDTTAFHGCIAYPAGSPGVEQTCMVLQPMCTKMGETFATTGCPKSDALIGCCHQTKTDNGVETPYNCAYEVATTTAAQKKQLVDACKTDGTFTMVWEPGPAAN